MLAEKNDFHSPPQTHHPGPWYCEGYDIECAPDDKDPGTTICEMVSSRSRGETHSNSLLISVTPDLLNQINTAYALTEADIQHLETNEGAQPEFDSYLAAEGFVLATEIIDGPTWD